jgi:hypothetical protein
MTEGGVFRAANNIILTDKQPFFIPYNIQVPEANYATYTREISGAGNTLAKYATIMMPFTLNVTDGIHTNTTDDGFSFYLRKMNAFTGQDMGNNNYYYEGNFTKIDGEKSEANIPYMVEVIQQKSDQYSFIATQYGSEIIATPTASNKGVMKIKGETAGGMTNFGTYSGVSIPREQNVFYFNRNKYVSSSTLAARYTHVYVQPFRSYFTSSPTGAKMTSFDIVYDKIYDNLVTNIAVQPQVKNLSISTTQGMMLLTATEDVHVSVASLNGFTVASFDMTAGDQQIIAIPAGIYLVNNAKVIVK